MPRHIGWTDPSQTAATATGAEDLDLDLVEQDLLTDHEDKEGEDAGRKYCLKPSSISGKKHYYFQLPRPGRR